MERWLYTYRTVPGDPAALARRLRGELRGLITAGRAQTLRAGGDGSFRVQLPVRGSGAEVTKAVPVTTGVAGLHDSRLVIPLTREANSCPARLPHLLGGIKLAPPDHSSAELTVVGSYRVPLVWSGADVATQHGRPNAQSGARSDTSGPLETSTWSVAPPSCPRQRYRSDALGQGEARPRWRSRRMR